MDRRAIDWKHSARHRHLLAKEFRTERNHNIVFAFDTGRLMSEPLGGVPKIDRAINAGLLLSYVSLRNGDRTMYFGFDAKPGLAIIIFSDFVDTLSAELMLEDVRRLTDRHLVLFATFEDEALSSMADAPPETTEDVSRAVIAGNLLSERDVVLRRLQRMGVQIIETRPEHFGGALLSRYLEIKRRDML